MKKWLLVILILCTTSPAYALTIDKMYTSTFGHYNQTYDPTGYASQQSFMIFSQADYYVLNDETNWDSGAGWHPDTYSTIQSVEVIGHSIMYNFYNPLDDILFQNTDYNSGNHSSQGVLGVSGPLTIIADIGANTGTMSGYTQVLSNDETWYGEPRFNYYSANVGDLVFYEIDFVLNNTVWTENLFERSFSYNLSGVVDFTASSVPEPATIFLLLTSLPFIMILKKKFSNIG